MYIQIHVVTYILVMLCVAANITITIFDIISALRERKHNDRKCFCRGAEVTTDE